MVRQYWPGGLHTVPWHWEVPLNPHWPAAGQGRASAPGGIGEADSQAPPLSPGTGQAGLRRDAGVSYRADLMRAVVRARLADDQDGTVGQVDDFVRGAAED